MPAGRRIAPILLLALLAAQAHGQAGGSPAAGGASLQVMSILESAELRPSMPLESFDAAGATLADLDGDGRNELWLLNDNARAYGIDLLQGVVRAELATPHPADGGNGTSWPTQVRNGLSVGDLDADGLPDLLVLNPGGRLSRFERAMGLDDERTLGMGIEWTQSVHAPDHDPSFWDTHPDLTPTPAHERPHLALGHPFAARTAPGAPALIFAQATGLPGQFAFRADGSLAWMATTMEGPAGPWVGHLRKAGPALAVFATADGQVVARQAATGREAWSYAVPEPGARFDVPPTVADVDGDGAAELLAAASMWDGPARFAQLAADGRPEWTATHPTGNPAIQSRPVAFDVQGDGVRDWIVLDHDPAGRRAGHLIALDGRDGTLLWTAQVDAPGTGFDLAVADVGGQGPAAVVPHQRDGRPGLAAFALADGRLAAWTAIPDAWTATRGALLDDVDGDGLLEAIVPVHRPGTACVPKADVPCREGGFLLVGTDAPAASLLESGAQANADPPLPPASRSAPERGAQVPAEGAPGLARAPDSAGARDGLSPAIPWWGLALAAFVALAMLAALWVVRRT